MKTLDIIRQKSAEYDNARADLQAQLSERFKQLVTNQGVSSVAAATNLRESTVSQYMRCKIAPISENQVIKAEFILNNL